MTAPSSSTSPDLARRRLLRRTTHRSRSLPAVLVLLLVTALAAWVATESVLRLLDRPALLARPGAVADGLVGLVEDPLPVALVVAGAAVVLGLVLIGLALTPGRRGRHTMAHERLAVVVDDGVVASALARTAAGAAHLEPGRAQVWIGRRRGGVALTPTSGVTVPLAEVRTAVEQETSRAALLPAPRVAVTTTSDGAVS